MPIFKYTVKGDDTARSATAPSKEDCLKMLKMSGEQVETIRDESDLDMPPLTEEEMLRMGLNPEIERLSREEEQRKKGGKQPPQQRQQRPSPQQPQDGGQPPIYRSQSPTLQEEYVQHDMEAESFFEQGSTTFMLKGGRLFVKNWGACDKKDYRVFRKNKKDQLIEITNTVTIEKLDWNEVPHKVNKPKTIEASVVEPIVPAKE